MDELVYLYGFVPAGTAAPPLLGLADAVIELVPLGPVSAVTARVPAPLYAPEQLETRLADLAWVASQGLSHEQIVAWFADHAEIAPAPLFTLYSSAAALEAAAGARVAAIAGALARLRGMREWNVKVAYDARDLERNAGGLSEAVRALDRELVGAAPGRRYLLERKRGDLVRVETVRLARERAAALLETLATFAERHQHLPIPREEEGGAVVLNAALLVRRDRAAALQATAAKEAAALAALGLRVAFSGPWAAYRFMEEVNG